MRRIGITPIQEVLDAVSPESEPNKRRSQGTFFGKKVYLNSLRYKVFKKFGTKCVTCGIEGAYFALEQCIGVSEDRAHFNLYALDADKKEIMLTKDHIIPRSKGGKDRLDNLQPMCSFCNLNKADTLN